MRSWEQFGILNLTKHRDLMDLNTFFSSLLAPNKKGPLQYSELDKTKQNKLVEEQTLPFYLLFLKIQNQQTSQYFNPFLFVIQPLKFEQKS